MFTSLTKQTRSSATSDKLWATASAYNTQQHQQHKSINNTFRAKNVPTAFVKRNYLILKDN